MKRREIIRNSAILAGAAATAGNVFASETKGCDTRFGYTHKEFDTLCSGALKYSWCLGLFG